MRLDTALSESTVWKDKLAAIRRNYYGRATKQHQAAGCGKQTKEVGNVIVYLSSLPITFEASFSMSRTDEKKNASSLA